MREILNLVHTGSTLRKLFCYKHWHGPFVWSKTGRLRRLNEDTERPVDDLEMGLGSNQGPGNICLVDF